MFKKNSPELKTLIGNFILVLLLSFATMYSDGSFKEFALYFGLCALGVGLLDIPVAVILLIAGKKEYGIGFLITAGILLLLCGISCGGYLITS